MNRSQQKWALARKDETIGGGWFVFRRHKSSMRIAPSPNGRPFEHSTEEAAVAEAKRLAESTLGEVYCVLHVTNAFIKPLGAAVAHEAA